MSPQAKTIQIFLPTGNPRGIRSAEMTTRTVRLIEVPRIHMKEFLTMEDATQVGLYFLVGSDELNGLPQLYIGQSGELRSRIQQHNLKKDFWERAFVMLSTNNTITQTHALYLEYKAIDIAKNAGRYKLLNGNNGSLPHTPTPLKADCEELFHTLSILLSTMGQPIFEALQAPDLSKNGKVALKTQTEHKLFLCKGLDADAKGYYDDDGFIVLKGSVIRKDSSDSLTGWSVDIKEELKIQGKLIDNNDNSYCLIENFLCKTPSGAANLVLGKRANGWFEWKNESGQTLDSVYR